MSVIGCLGRIAAGFLVAAAMATSALAQFATVSDDVNVRAGPGLQYEIVGELAAGSAVEAMGCSGAWCRVRSEEVEGWVAANYLADAPSPRVYAPPATIYVPPIDGYGRPRRDWERRRDFGQRRDWDRRPRPDQGWRAPPAPQQEWRRPPAPQQNLGRPSVPQQGWRRPQGGERMQGGQPGGGVNPPQIVRPTPQARPQGQAPGARPQRGQPGAIQGGAANAPR